MNTPPQRFKIALSFPGEQRAFVEQVAEQLASQVGRDRVLYDKYYEAEFARPDLDTYLQRLYHDESELIAVFLCADYERKDWCGLEWRALRDLIKRRQSSAIMPLRFDNTTIPGLFSTDGYIWIGSNRTPNGVADLILQRWQINTGQTGVTLPDRLFDQVDVEPGPVGTPKRKLSSGLVKLELCQRLRDTWRDLADYCEIPPHERDRFQPGYEAQGVWEWLDARRRLGELPEALRFIKRDDLVTRLVERWAESADAYYLAAIARWSQPRYALDRQFVNLTLLLDQGADTPGPRWQVKDRFQDLREVLKKVPDQALVLLGPPGSGKSTLLRHHELDTARQVLAEVPAAERDQAPLTFFVPLNDYPARQSGEPLSPLDWLTARWQKTYPDLPNLATLLRQQRLTLLLDALNELPAAGDDPVAPWRALLRELAYRYPGNRVIFSCRSLDYSATLSTDDLPVPQVRIEQLSDDQVRQFLDLYSPAHSAKLWDNLQGTPQLELLRTAYYLGLLVQQSADGQIPNGRASLFTGFVRQMLKRELLKGNPLLKDNILLSERDCRRLLHVQEWSAPCELPSGGLLLGQLRQLAYQMQLRRPEREASQVRLNYDAALAILGREHGEVLLKAGEAIGVLDEDLRRDEVLFIHQLMQEYFAARQLATAPEPTLVNVPWRVTEVQPSLAEKRAELAVADPLPLLPGTG